MLMFNNLGLEPSDICQVCVVCGSPFVDTHHIFPNTGRRKLCDKYGYTVHLCREHHSEVHHNPNEGLDLELKQVAQRNFEEHYGSREDFIKLFSRNYL